LETVPALLASPRTKSDPARAGRKLPLWPIGVLLGVGGIALWQLVPGTETEASTGAFDDGRVVAVLAADAGAAEQLQPTREAGLASGSLDPEAGQLALGDDGGLEAAQPTLSSFEREERAKDALERAERALSNGDRAAAEAALNEAFQYDPEHPDIAALRRKL
jgi:hypothetical protein